MHTLPDPTRRISRASFDSSAANRARSFHAPLLTKPPTNTTNHHNYDFSTSSRILLNSTLIRIDMKLGLWTVVVVVAVAVLPAARGIWLDLPSSGSGTKCVSEELHDNVVVLADYYAFIGDEYDANTTLNPIITVKVTSPYGNNIHHQEKVSHGQFAFTTTESGNYLACFSVDGDDHGGKKVTVGIDWKTGIAAKDWDSVARKEKIEGLELELKKLEESVQTIHSNLIYLINRESEMREVSETTNARVAWYSATSLGVCIVVSIVQVSYLRQYFRKKKLI